MSATHHYQAETIAGGVAPPGAAPAEPDWLARAQAQFFALSPDLLSIAGFDGRFRWLNPAWEATLGFPLAELLGSYCFDLLHPDDHDITRAAARELVENGRTIAFRNRYRCQDGTYRWLAWNAAFAADGLIYATARDITEQQRAEVALRESEQRYRTVIAALEEGVIVQDQDGRIVTANASAERVLGMTTDRLLGNRTTNPAWSAIREDGTPFALTALPGMLALRSGLPQTGAVMGVRRPNWPLTWLEVNSRPLFREGEAAPYGVVTSFFDISGRKRAEAALREGERRFRAIFDQTYQFIGLLSPDGILLEANQTALDFGGVTAAEVVGLPLWETAWWVAMGAATQARLRQAIAEAAAGAFVRYEVAVRGAGDRVATIDFSLKPVRDEDGRVVLLIPEGRDITEQKLAAAALRASEVRFRDAYAYAAIGIALIGLDGRWLDVNRAMCDIIGYTAEELAATTFQVLTHPDDLESDLDLVRQLLAGAITHFHLEKRYLHKQGQIVWVMLSVSLVRDEYGAPRYFLSQVQDITARKQAEAELRESEERARALWAEADRQARELALLDQVRTALTREPDPAHLFRTVVEAIACTFGYTQVSLYLREGDELVLQQQVGYDRVIARVPLGLGVSGRVVRTGDAAFLADVRDDPAFLGAIDGIVSEVCVPLITEEGVVGVLNVESTNHTALTVADLRLMEALATHIGIAIGRARLYTALSESERDYRLLLDQAADGIFISDSTGRYLTVNAQACTLSGYPREELLRCGVDDLIDIDDLATTVQQWKDLQDNPAAVAVAERRLRRKDGSLVAVEISARLLPDGRLQEIARDITERKRAEAELRRRAFHDSLTGLPNRDLFNDRLHQALARSRRHTGQHFAVLCLDLDRFKQVNDSLGHPAGDALLVEIARRLERCVREGDTVARLGGDEFAILLEDLTLAETATEVAVRVQHAIARPFSLGEHEVTVSTSVGIVLGAARYGEPAELLRDVDIALYRSKAQGRARHVVFDEGMHAQAVALLQLENDLRRAIERREFVLHYQPVVALDTGALLGFEALLRWLHPRRGLVSPGEFIPLAEETGLIIPLGRWVLEAACRQLAAWRALSPGLPLTINVNLSTRQFVLPDLAEQVAAALQAAALPAHCLRLELTESALMEQPAVATATLAQLRALGVQVQIDDFGIGYSSLSYLQRFPLDALKIDRSFVAELGATAEASAIVETVVSLARGLGLQVIAEGVETPEQCRALRTLGCLYGQGYLFAPPLPPDEARAFLPRLHPTAAVTPA